MMSNRSTRCKLKAAGRKIFERNKGLYGEIMEQWANGSFNTAPTPTRRRWQLST